MSAVMSGVRSEVVGEVRPFAVTDPDVSHVIIEIFGGDNNLSDYVDEDMAEMLAGTRGDFAMLGLADVAQDRAGVLELSPRIRGGRRVVEDWGEIDTGDPETLASFLARALVTYGPGVRKAIGFWDHGSGVFDEGDPNETLLERRAMRTPRHLRARSFRERRLFLSRYRNSMDPGTRAMLHDDTNAGVLTNLEATGVLKAAFARAGQQEKVDVIFSDTCLNGMIEVLDQLKDFAHCIVASEELEPGDGWEYQEWLSLMSDRPPGSADAWADQAVDAFGRGYAGRTNDHPCTLAAFRSDQAISDAFAALVAALRPLGDQGFGLLLQARTRTQSFASDYDSFDLRDFADRLAATTTDQSVVTACRDLRGALDQACVRSVALGPTVKRAHGLAFWFPGSFATYERDIDTYRRLAFARHTGWADYLDTQFG
jgi:hypothetical protein